MANRNWASAGKQYSMHIKPVLLDCNFIVDSTNGNGLGIRSLKGPCVQNVFMHTTAASVSTTSVFAIGAQTITLASVGGLYVGMTVTDATTAGNITSGTLITAINVGAATVTLSKVTAGASASAPGDTLHFAWAGAGGGLGSSNPSSPNIAVYNPNPAAGTIIVQMQDIYNRSLTGCNSIISPLGSNLKVDASDAALTVGVAYVITIVGDATAADWLALGLPAGVTPAVGASFIAAATGSGTASVTRVAPTAATGSQIFTIETVGDPNQSIAPKITSQGFGAQFILQCRNASGSSAASAIAAPANGSVISLQFLLSDSSILVQGE